MAYQTYPGTYDRAHDFDDYDNNYSQLSNYSNGRMMPYNSINNQLSSYNNRTMLPYNSLNNQLSTYNGPRAMPYNSMNSQLSLSRPYNNYHHNSSLSPMRNSMGMNYHNNYANYGSDEEDNQVSFQLGRLDAQMEEMGHKIRQNELKAEQRHHNDRVERQLERSEDRAARHRERKEDRYAHEREMHHVIQNFSELMDAKDTRDHIYRRRSLYDDDYIDDDLLPLSRHHHSLAGDLVIDRTLEDIERLRRNRRRRALLDLDDPYINDPYLRERVRNPYSNLYDPTYIPHERSVFFGPGGRELRFPKGTHWPERFHEIIPMPDGSKIERGNDWWGPWSRRVPYGKRW